jgi:GTP cyclohydrolase I
MIAPIAARHPQPFGMGRTGIMPIEYSNLIGLAKHLGSRDRVMSRSRIQGGAVVRLATILPGKVEPNGQVVVILESDRFCTHWRGVKAAKSRMTNSVTSASFLMDRNPRQQSPSLLSKKNGHTSTR